MTSIIAFFILICVLVFVHEYGHFWAARRCGVKVIRFSIGFGKVLYKKTDKQGTEFAFSLIPLGGYVQMYNDEPEFNGQAHQSLAQKSIAQRAFIIFAGPLANFLFALMAYWLIFVNGLPTVKPVIAEVSANSIAATAQLPEDLEITEIAGSPVRDWNDATLALLSEVGHKNVSLVGHLIDDANLQHFELDLSHWQIDNTKENPLTSIGIRPKGNKITSVIKKVETDSAAEKAGLKAGDNILAVNRKSFEWQTLVKAIQTGEPVELEIERKTEKMTFVIQPEKKGERYLIGIVPSYELLADKYRTELKYGILEALSKSLEKVYSLSKTICSFIGNLITGDISVKNMGGAISIAKGAGISAESGWIYYLGFMALISVNLGVMNLFPILPLDGGQLVLLASEAIRGKPLSRRVQLTYQQIGMVLVLSLMAFTFINDVIHF